ncbi:DUF7521 family protein [Halocatena marina]|uniref:DUF2304 domain-containing protein n=1 Tax=Halocatena marina TaxID=2934937 RepID=A0ABD5YW39_9EURY|nr:hypothetical protein [Halocatena marina]
MTDVITPLIIDTVAIRLGTAGLLAIGGVVIAYQGYRGYVRNDNRTLLFLTVGILFLTTIPVVVEGGLRLTDALVSSHVNIVVLFLIIFGLVVILYAFTRT